MLHDDLHVAKLELQGEVVPLDNNTVITIIEDTGAESVKVKLKKSKSKEKIFWASRSSVVRSELPELSGS